MGDREGTLKRLGPYPRGQKREKKRAEIGAHAKESWSRGKLTKGEGRLKGGGGSC